MKTTFSPIAILVMLSIVCFESASCKRRTEEPHTPVPDNCTTSYYIELTDSGGTTVYQGTSTEKTGSTFTIKNDKTSTKLYMPCVTQGNDITDILTVLYLDENNNLLPLGKRQNSNNVSEMVVSLKDAGYVSGSTATATHSLSNVTYYPYKVVLRNTGKVTYRYDFANVVLVKPDESHQYTATGHIICTAD